MNLKAIATSDTITLNPTDSIDKAMAMMEEHGIHHLPVTEDGRPVGMVSDRDLLSAVGWMSKRERINRASGPATVGPKNVAEIMSAPVRTMEPDDPIEDAARLLLTNRISAIPLVSDDRVVGIVSETNFLQCYLDHRSITLNGGWRQLQVADHMTSNVFTVRPKDSPLFAFRLMRQKQIRHLVVVEGGRLLGIISDRDVRKSFGKTNVEDAIQDEAGPEQTWRTSVEDIMSQRIQTIRQSATLSVVANQMVRHRIGVLVVMDGPKLVGVISETDLLRALVSACAHEVKQATETG